MHFGLTVRPENFSAEEYPDYLIYGYGAHGCMCIDFVSAKSHKFNLLNVASFLRVFVNIEKKQAGMPTNVRHRGSINNLRMNENKKKNKTLIHLMANASDTNRFSDSVHTKLC